MIIRIYVDGDTTPVAELPGSSGRLKLDTTSIPVEPPSMDRGAAVFAGKCAACHGSDGEGRRVTGRIGYQFPPLWGANMPYGLRDVLTEQEAWDVAMFVDSHERPQDPRFSGNLAETRARYHDSKWSPTAPSTASAIPRTIRWRREVAEPPTLQF
jgi:cytochrome c